MGSYVRNSPLIVIADIETKGAPSSGQILTIRDVVRGDAKQGDTIPIPLGDVSHWFTPQSGKNVAVLLDAEWRTKPKINQTYSQPDEIAALREFVKIYNVEGERAQLLALQAKVSDANPQYAKQLLADFASMRDPKNFDIVLSSYKLLNSTNRESLINLLGTMNDQRALPLLIEALESSEKSDRIYATMKLTYNFRGAGGVREAFLKMAQNPNTSALASQYLSKYESLDNQKPLTSWLAAALKLKNGEIEAAKSQYFTLIEGENSISYGVIEAAKSLLPVLNDDEKGRLRRILNALLLKENENYLYAENGITLLRQLPDASNTEALLHVLVSPAKSPYTPWDKTSRMATFALNDMGPKARNRATDKVLGQIETRLQPDINLKMGEETLYFCQLAWLADDVTWQTVLSELTPPFAAKMKALQPIRDAANSKQEAAMLSTLLPDTSYRWQGDSILWIITRLGELRDQTAVTPLFEELERSRYSGRSNQIEAALISIGGEAVENGAMKLLRHEHNELRESGMNIFRALQGEKMRPLLRRMLTEDNFGVRSYAVFQLGYIGQPGDLPLLLPFTNFWESDRAIQSRAVDAVAEIRDRYNYDLNGPIVRH